MSLFDEKIITSEYLSENGFTWEDNFRWHKNIPSHVNPFMHYEFLYFMGENSFLPNGTLFVLGWIPDESSRRGDMRISAVDKYKNVLEPVDIEAIFYKYKHL